ncbi:hypothetical protein Ancab_016989 [Ancistrocladus abbreviatus]
MNKLHRTTITEKNVEDTWELLVNLGVISEAVDLAMVGKIVEMEARDKNNLTGVLTGAEFFSPKIQSGTDKMESVAMAKGATMDSLSRIPGTPKEMNSARSEKEVYQSGDIHTTSKEGAPKFAKIPSESSRLRQDKKEHTEVVCNLSK